MKKTFTVCLCISMICALLIYSGLNNNAISYSDGAPTGHTGAPADNFKTCTECHNTGPAATFVAGIITSDVPADGFTSGNTYTITATVNGEGHDRFGFEIAAIDGSGNAVGTLSTGGNPEVQIYAGIYITHTGSGTENVNSKTWTFNWTAPSNATTTVNFYGAFNISNHDFTTNGDTIITSSMVLQKKTLSVSTQQTDISCNGANDGTATVNVNGTGSYYYLWGTNPIQFSQSVSGLAAGTYTVTVGENGIPGQVVDTVTILEPTPLSVSIMKPSGVCQGSQLTLNAQPMGGTPPYTFLWNNAQTTATIQDFLSAPANYSVTVTDVNNCKAGPVSAQIAVFSLPQASFTNVVNEDTVTLNNTSSNSISFIWDFGDSDTSMQTNPVHIYQQPGLFDISLIAISADNCLDTATATVNIIVTALKEFADNIHAAVYPIPAGEIIYVDLNVQDTQKIRMEISDILGNVLMIKDDFPDKNQINIRSSFDISNYPDGVYFISIYSGKQKAVHKIQKSR